jgi:outer membrane biosynthesis protein TonB
VTCHFRQHAWGAEHRRKHDPTRIPNDLIGGLQDDWQSRAQQVTSPMSTSAPHSAGGLIMFGAAAAGSLAGLCVATFSGSFAALRPIASYFGGGAPRPTVRAVQVSPSQPAKVIQTTVSTNGAPISVAPAPAPPAAPPTSLPTPSPSPSDQPSPSPSPSHRPSPSPSHRPSPSPSGRPSPSPSSQPSPSPLPTPTVQPSPSPLPTPSTLPSPTPCVSTPSKPC